MLRGLTFQTFLHVYKTYLLTNIIAPTGNLGLSRSAMPQIDKSHLEDFKKFLIKQGLTVKEDKIPVENLKLTQNEYSRGKVMKMMDHLNKGNSHDHIFVSNDGFVLDGSHRLIALYNTNKQAKINAYVVDTPMMNLLKVARKYPFAKYRNVSDSSIQGADQQNMAQ